MCGILAIINKNRNCNGRDLERACSIIRHRGPDDEGFLTWSPGTAPTVWAGKDTAASTRGYWNYADLPPDTSFKAGLGHRRLSILDLSPTGHQPMVYEKAGLSVVFNGEIYNYLEIKTELETLGHKFNSTSDTEVILHAWEEWGPDCLHEFNGMFAIVILDQQAQKLYAARDRFGVKPLYFYEGADAIYFASEIKQIRTAPGYRFELDEKMARQFLALGMADHDHRLGSTFDKNIKHTTPGWYICVDLTGDSKPEHVEWYFHDTWADVSKYSYKKAMTEYKKLLTDAVKLRLRSDVKVGSCLSGGLDSSSIVCIAADLLRQSGDHAGQETVTACFENLKYDEWKFAEEVINKSGAHPHRVFPTFSEMVQDLDRLIWHQDEPFSSTSMFSQWMVFKKTHEAGLKVMIDGQGADEQLAGYGGNDVPLYAEFIGRMHLGSLLDEARHYKKENSRWPVGFLLGGLQAFLGKTMSRIIPAKYRIKDAPPVDWLTPAEPGSLDDKIAEDLHEHLRRQFSSAPLPALLRYEDRNSMAWSVESRTPFMDFRLVEFCRSIDSRGMYWHGIRKKILRDAMHGIIPPAIENRKDKMGFVTPEELWLKGEGKEWFLDGIDKACKQFGGTLLNEEKVKKYVFDIIEGRREFDSMPWRIVCFHRWYNSL